MTEMKPSNSKNEGERPAKYAEQAEAIAESSDKEKPARSLARDRQPKPEDAEAAKSGDSQDDDADTGSDDRS